MKLPLYFLSVLVLVACDQQTEEHVRIIPESSTADDYSEFVNPMVGTSRMGHTFPGATAPFGMVQLSPQTNFIPMFNDEGNYNRQTYEYCAGYQYADSIILGFAHTNFSGTGHSDLGDFLLMPTTGELNLEPLQNEDGAKGFFSSFSHENEKASPGYYSVELDDYNIQAELTASERVGFHRYTFEEGGDAHLVLDMVYNVYHHDNKNVWTFIRVENDTLITGYRQTKGWARTRMQYFAMSFSKPIKNYGQRSYDETTYNGFWRRFDETQNFPEMAGKNLRAYFDFDLTDGEQLMVKCALSPVGMDGALKNLEAEIPHWDFDQVAADTRAKWNEELSVVEAEFDRPEDKTTFYTALYHTMLTPILYEDVDGRYRGLDQNIHTSDGFTNYTIFSLWDTYRALHPLFNVLKPERNNDMIKSMLAHQEQSVHGMLPVWSHYANENWCMIGYHAVSAIADAAVKDVGDFDREKALAACIETANVRYFDGLGDYLEYGYVPDDKSHSSVSKTLELAYDDWCIAQLALKVGDNAAANEFLNRSRAFEKNWDPSVGFMRPRMSDGSFREDFDPLDTHGQGFIEGNAWNYGLYVPHAVDDMMALMGGNDRFVEHLDSLFSMQLDDKYIEKNEDITRDGIMGNYVHGNEPSHHVAYLYNWAGRPDKTRERVQMIMRDMYGQTEQGLCGNDDAGQMSAWFVFSALGFYPVAPGSDEYALGEPLVKEARIKLNQSRDGNRSTAAELKITAVDQAKDNSVKLNGKELQNFLTHTELVGGGVLEFGVE